MTAHEARRETLLYWLALHLTPGLGAQRALRLVKILGHPERIFHSSLSELEAAMPQLPKATAESIHAGIAFEEAADELRKAEGAGVVVVPYQDPRYPERLKEIYDPPLLLYVRGRAELLQSHTVAVVGTRRPTAYGKAVAEKLSRDMVRLGLTHVSGMARGIDTASHKGALEAGGDTVAVLGTGVDTPYPKENRKLYDDIAHQGCVVSEFRMGTTPFPQNFPLRNRIISGMSMGVLVIEGAQYSGSLITARLALEHDREVFAVPGNIVSAQSWGPNLLIKDGAKLVQTADDIVEELPVEVRAELAARAEQRRAEAAADPSGGVDLSLASPTAKRVVRTLRLDEARHVDDIIRECGDITPPQTLAALSELELLGVIRQLPGKTFIRAYPDGPGPAFN
ncbi:MAG: DNA-processing protein DprA [Acidobacteria bacterium]|nr:DNA-processing protein DprA [Acidobacteriota bacterium]